MPRTSRKAPARKSSSVSDFDTSLFPHVRLKVKRWRKPTPEEKAGGDWLVGVRVKLKFEEPQVKWYEGHVVSYDPDPDEADNDGNLGPYNKILYLDGDKSTNNLSFSDWELEDGAILQNFEWGTDCHWGKVIEPDWVQGAGKR